MTEGPECERTREAIPELAAGALAGDERAAVLAHLSGCPACRAELAEATRVVDALTALAPSEEPQAAFESRVLARINPRRSRWRSLGLHLVTAAVVAGLAAGAVWVATGPDRELAAGYRSTLAVADGRYLTAAVIYADRQRVGHAFGYQESPSWIFLTIETAGGSYRAELIGTNGVKTDLGPMSGTSWGATVPMPIAQIAQIRLRQPGSPDLVATFH